MNSSRHDRGFTLLELLVVMVMMAVISAAAISSLNYAFSDDTAKHEADRLAALIGLAAEEALLSGREIGLEFTDREYAFYRFDDRLGRWDAAEADGPFRARELDDHLAISLQLDDQPVLLTDPENEGPQPQIILYSSGEATAFELEIEDLRDQARWQLTGDLLGRVEKEPLP